MKGAVCLERDGDGLKRAGGDYLYGVVTVLTVRKVTVLCGVVKCLNRAGGHCLGRVRDEDVPSHAGFPADHPEGPAGSLSYPPRKRERLGERVREN